MCGEDFSDRFQVDLDFLLNSSFSNGFYLSHYLLKRYLLKLFKILNLIKNFLRKNLISKLEFYFNFLKKHWKAFLFMNFYHFHFRTRFSE